MNEDLHNSIRSVSNRSFVGMLFFLIRGFFAFTEFVSVSSRNAVGVIRGVVTCRVVDNETYALANYTFSR